MMFAGHTMVIKDLQITVATSSCLYQEIFFFNTLNA